MIKSRKHKKEDKEGTIGYALTPHIIKKINKWIKDADCAITDKISQRN